MFVLMCATLLFSLGCSTADTGAPVWGRPDCRNGFCITLSEGDITAEAGLCVVIPCSFTVDYYTRFTSQHMVWYKCEGRCRDQDIILDSDNNNMVQSGFKGRVSLLEPDVNQKKCSIIINDLTESDSGSYQLRVNGFSYGYRSGFNFPTKATFSVKGLTQKPTVMVPPLTEGQQTTLTCTAPGLCSGSVPTITWTWRGAGEDDSHISGNITAFKTENLTAVTQRHSSTLTFNSSAEHHGSIITCKVRFTNGTTTEETMTLNVTSYPKILNHSQCEHQSDVLTCVCISEGFPSPTVQWPLLQNHTEFSVMTSVSKHTVSSTVTLTVKDHSNTVVECISSNEAGEIQWNIPITTSESREGSFCQQWASFLPQSVQGLSGSCVRVSCRFTIPSGWDSSLNPLCRAIWKRGYIAMFNTSNTGGRADLTGDLLQKDCSTILKNLKLTDSGTYDFRLECNNGLKFNFWNTVTQITITDSLPSPSITPSSLEVEEGTPVRLNCSAVAPCPILPPALTWTPTIGDVEENPETEFMTSAISFTASELHNGQRLVCAALYSRQSASSPFETDTNLTLQVLYPPKNTSVSYPSPVREGTSVTLTCSANANPAVNSYTWYKVDGGQETEVGSNKQVLTTVSEADEQFYCKVANKYGTQNSSVTDMDVQFPPKEVTVVVEPEGPILEGSSVTLFCRSRANPPVAVSNYTWYKDDEEDESGESWVINHVDPSYSGAYHCAARNELGEETSASIQLDVQYVREPIITGDTHVREGDSLSLTCSVESFPPAPITWTVLGSNTNLYDGLHADLQNNSGSAALFLPNVTVQHSGRYICTAKHLDRTVTASAEVTVTSDQQAPCAVLPWVVVAGVSLVVNVICIILLVFLWNTRNKVKPKQEDRTYMSLKRTDQSMMSSLNLCTNNKPFNM
ncbi:sialoadhesin-like [Centropristis striata]|uniref:sialoadhesin-like n=1 Tax=Centropristis striata TaxID=184440 RepID=UPI0027E1032F|nr:sialoadhesin-like [Centropristis striata]